MVCAGREEFANFISPVLLELLNFADVQMQNGFWTEILSSLYC